MQCITVRSSFVARACASRRSYRPMVVRANIGDDVLKTFSPSKDNQPKSGVQTGFSASPRHHGGREPGRQSSAKPFADGYQKGGQVKLAKKEADQATEQEGEQEEGVAEYLGEAVQNLAGHNFTGDDTEPPKNTGAAGWKGDIHDRKTDGFHTRKI